MSRLALESTVYLVWLEQVPDLVCRALMEPFRMPDPVPVLGRLELYSTNAHSRTHM